MVAGPPERSGEAGAAPDPGAGRTLTVPNAITALRLCAVPVFVVLLARAHRSGWYSAAVLLGALGATDWVDGFLARRLHQVSTLGKILDPLADRLLVLTATVSIIVVGAIPLPVAVIAVAREIFVGTGFLVVAVSGGGRIDVRLVGKAATFCLMVALPLFLAGHAPIGWHRWAEDLAWVFVVPGLALGWYAALTYVPHGLAMMREGRRSKVTAHRGG